MVSERGDHGKYMKHVFHDLSPFVERIQFDPLTLRLEEVAKCIGYSVKLSSGVLKHDSQTDEFIQVLVIDGNGNEIHDGDGGCLDSYEPVFIHSRHGKVKLLDNWFYDTLCAIKQMTSVLLFGGFIVEGPEVGTGIVESSFGIVRVLRHWKEKRVLYSMIQMLRNDDPSVFPRVGDEVTIDGQKGTVVSLALE